MIDLCPANAVVGTAKLPDVVGNVLEHDSHDEHSKQGWQLQVHLAGPLDDAVNEQDKVTADKSQEDENFQSEYCPPGCCQGAEQPNIARKYGNGGQD